MKILLVILSLLIASQVLSQTKEIEFGKISTQEIEMICYEKDKEAKAVVLYDKGKSIFFHTDNGYDIRFIRHKRIKIFDKSESQYAEISIPYYVDGYGKTEVVKSIEAITYNSKNGRLTQKKLDPSTIYEERINERWVNKKFVFPDVQDGSILEFIYVLESPFHFNLPDWTFQDKIPTIYSEYEVRMIPFYEYVFLVQGISRFDYQNSVIAKEKRNWGSVAKSYGLNVGRGVEFQDYVHTYVLKDVPAFKDESYISSINDYIIKMDFQLAKFHSPQGGTSDIISTWPALSESLLKHKKFGKYLKGGSRFAKKIIEEDLELAGLDEIKKAQKIIEYIKNSFEWDGSYSKYASQTVKDFINKKNGNVADINLFLIALLNEADIEAQPLILSTRNHGKIPLDYPFDHFTNYVIALVNTNSPFLADGTEDLLPFNMLPTRCFNKKGLVVNKEDEPQWISLTSNILSLEKKAITLTIDTLTLDVKTRVFIQSTQYESFSNRKRFKNDTLKIKEYYSDKIGAVNRTKTYGYQNTSFPYSINLEGNYETEKLGKNIVIRPFLNLPLSTNTLSEKTRSYPVDFVYPLDNQFESTLEIPNGFTLTTLPESYKLNNAFAEINLNYAFSDGDITAIGNYKFKKAVYVASEYSTIKYYLDQIVKYFNQQIVIEKDN
jgi:hypothetical protein